MKRATTEATREAVQGFLNREEEKQEDFTTINKSYCRLTDSMTCGHRWHRFAILGMIFLPVVFGAILLIEYMQAQKKI